MGGGGLPQTHRAPRASPRHRRSQGCNQLPEGCPRAPSDATALTVAVLETLCGFWIILRGGSQTPDSTIKAPVPKWLSKRTQTLLKPHKSRWVGLLPRGGDSGGRVAWSARPGLTGRVLLPLTVSLLVCPVSSILSLSLLSLLPGGWLSLHSSRSLVGG